MGRDVMRDCCLVRDVGSRADTRLRHVSEPARQEFPDCLPIVNNELSILSGFQRIPKRRRNVAPRAPVNGLAPRLAVLPPKVHARHPAAVAALNDAALSSSAAFRAHVANLSFGRAAICAYCSSFVAVRLASVVWTRATPRALRNRHKNSCAQWANASVVHTGARNLRIPRWIPTRLTSFSSVFSDGAK